MRRFARRFSPSWALLSILIFIAPLTSQGADGHPPVASQLRAPEEAYQDAVARYEKALQAEGRIPSVMSAYSVSVPLARADFSNVPDWGGMRQVGGGFAQIRDERFLILPEAADFPRRLSWLYPDDGCFARAALAGQRLEAEGYPRPYKLFIFGNLAVRTRNAPSGKVYWWYHVVPVVSDGNEPYVIDPAIRPGRPLEVYEWVRTMVSDPGSVTVSVCKPTAYEPGSQCRSNVPSNERGARSDEGYYLRLEWKRIQSLGRDPRRELGDFPPWS